MNSTYVVMDQPQELVLLAMAIIKCKYITPELDKQLNDMTSKEIFDLWCVIDKLSN